MGEHLGGRNAALGSRLSSGFQTHFYNFSLMLSEICDKEENYDERKKNHELFHKFQASSDVQTPQSIANLLYAIQILYIIFEVK